VDPVVVSIPLGIAIGLVVGAVGGGGSILALPVLVYILGQRVGPASTASLIVIAIAAGIGGGALALRGHVCWRVALTFAPPAAVGSLAGTLGNHAVSSKVLILSFVPVIALAAAATWRRAAGTHTNDAGACPPVRPARSVLVGVGVGALTGFFGVGGGFLVVPVLTLWFDFTFRRAVATSLVIITLTGLAALASHLIVGATVNVPLTAALSGSTALGALIGSGFAQRIPQAALGRGFAIVVGALGVFLLVDTLLLNGPPHG
jgi:uncharacterized membrane protein YfcA